MYIHRDQTTGFAFLIAWCLNIDVHRHLRAFLPPPRAAASGAYLQGVKDLRWLSFVCADCASSRGGGFTGDELAEGVCRILLAGQDDQEAAAEMLELLGDDAFDLVTARAPSVFKAET